MKNYFSTAIYLRRFLAKKSPSGDINLEDLNYSFITGLEFYIRNNPLKAEDPCTNNGTMKHLERVKKMITWATANEWIEKNPFTTYKLKLKSHEMEFLREDELARVETRDLANPMLQRIRDLFVFSCYTGLAYSDLMDLQPGNILVGVDGLKWIKTSRKKTDIPVNVPMLKPALAIMDKFNTGEGGTKRETVFPRVSNQEMNRGLKLIAEICEVKKYLTFHLARHTFATTVTLLNGVPIETISKLLGHTKLSTTMIYTTIQKSIFIGNFGGTEVKIEKSLKAIRNTGQDENLSNLKGTLFEYLLFPVVRLLYPNATIIQDKTISKKSDIGKKEKYEYDFIVLSTNPKELVIIEVKGYSSEKKIQIGNKDTPNTLSWFFGRTLPFIKGMYSKDISDGYRLKASYITSGGFYDDGVEYLGTQNKYKSKNLSTHYDGTELLYLLDKYELAHIKKTIQRYYLKNADRINNDTLKG